MATERDFELLDDYLGNRLGAEEKAVFEQRLEADPELKSEFQLQQQLINSIRNARARELKSMLQNIPVSTIPHGGTSFVAKIAAGTIIAGAIATGIYWYTRTNDDATTPQRTLPQATEQETTVEEQKSVDEGSVADQKPASDIVIERQPAKNTQDNNTVSPESKPTIEVYDPTEEAEGTDDHVGQVDSQPPSAGKAGPSVSVTVDKTNSEYGFHYQFKDGKLFLYGPFERNLYEIMEFFSGEKRTIFLYHKEKYFLLKEDGEDIRQLSELTDPALVKKLQESRN